jgi:phage baseplate assembly protein W
MITSSNGPRLPLLSIALSGSSGSISSYENKMFPKAETNIALIVSSLQNIFNTLVGERPMSDFGTNLGSLSFEPYNSQLSILGSELIREAITQYEPRVTILGITWSVSDDNHQITWSVSLQQINDPLSNFTVDFKL